jgi:uncharacterized protein
MDDRANDWRRNAQFAGRENALATLRSANGPGDSRFSRIALFHAAGGGRVSRQLARHHRSHHFGVYSRHIRRAHFEQSIRRGRKVDFFRVDPGGAMAMAVLADRYGAQIAPVAVAHSLRVSVVVILIPLALTYGGLPLEASAYRPTVPLNLSILAVWLAISWLLGEISEKFGFHNGCLLVPIFFGAALTMSGVQLSAVPHGLTDFAQLMFGLVLGARYERAFFARYRLFIPFALLNSFFIVIASVAAGAALAWAFDLPVATMIIATSPGGLAEMTITAQALQISVPLVVAFHLFRVVVVNMGTQYIYVWTAWMLNRGAEPAREPTS